MRELVATRKEAPSLLRARIATDGYGLIRGCVDRGSVERLAVAVETIIDDLGLRSAPDVVEAFRATRTPFYRALQRRAEFHEPTTDAQLRGSLQHIIGPELFAHPRRLLRTIPPGAPALVTPAHQDFTYIGGSADTFTVWMPLRACEPDSGALRILVGSHADGPQPHVARDAVAGSGVDVDDDDPRWAGTAFAPGDVVIFHSLTVHGGLPNRSSRWRLSADYRFQSTSDPVDPRSLLPSGHPAVPDWPELLAGTDWDRERLVGISPGLGITAG
ncbi:MAG: phytanoyl-CoA dioxygenase family protein [Actinomycetota bacterium]